MILRNFNPQVSSIFSQIIYILISTKIKCKMIKATFKKIIKITKPLIWRIAEAYDIKVQRPGVPVGRHPVIIAGGKDVIGVTIPKSTYFNTACGHITIDENVIMGEDVKFLTGMHLNVEDSKKQGLAHHTVPESGRRIHVERGCYIGSNAVVIGPARIGEYSVIGAGAIVTKDIPPYSVVYGAAASVVRKIETKSEG